MQLGEKGGIAVQHGLGGQGAKKCPVWCPELPRDIWQEVWDRLSCQELARLAGVSWAWRSAAAARTAARRAKAAARVIADESVPDDRLTAAQWVFRGILRVLRGLDAITGEPLDSDSCNNLALRRRGLMHERWNRGTCYLTFQNSCAYAERQKLVVTFAINSPGYEGPSAKDAEGDTLAPWVESSSGFCAAITLMPHSPREAAWMQGLLLALSNGTLGDLHTAGTLSRLEGPLANCVKLSIKWDMVGQGRRCTQVLGKPPRRLSLCRGCSRIFGHAEIYRAPLMRLWGVHTSRDSPAVTFEREVLTE